MRYYYIISRLNGLVLDLENAGNKPVPRVIPWERSTATSQLWYDDPDTGTIRNKYNEYCIDVEDIQLSGADCISIVKPYQQGDRNQQWERHESQIRNRKDHHKVLDILRSDMNPGAEVGPYKRHDSLNQSWDFEFVDDDPWNASEQNDPAMNSRRFYIVSQLNDFVVDIAGCDADEGTKIITWPIDEDVKRNQLWYFDQQGYIRSDLNDMVFSNDGKKEGENLKMKRFEGNNPRGQWLYDERTNKIYSRSGEALDIRGENKNKGSELCSYEFKGSPNQLWRLQYV